MDSLLLKWHIRKNGDTLTSLAEAMGLHPQTLYLKYKEGGAKKLQFSQNEIRFIANRYKLTKDDIIKIFFGDIS